MVLNNKMDMAMRCYKGSGSIPDPPPAPPPPSPTSAADNVRKSDELKRRRNAYGFRETILTSPQGVSGMQSQTVMKTLLGG
jgi:hypothetical protein